MKHIIVTPDISGALETYLYGAGASLWNYHASAGIWVSSRELTDRERDAARAINGSHVVIPINRVVNGLG